MGRIEGKSNILTWHAELAIRPTPLTLWAIHNFLPVLHDEAWVVGGYGEVIATSGVLCRVKG
jgi:hypothetical protein